MKLFGRLLVGAKDILKGYKLTAIEVTDELFLAKGEEKNQQTLISTNDNKDVIEGMVFEISEEELLISDSYEPAGYKRIRVKLELGKKAWVYIAYKMD